MTRSIQSQNITLRLPLVKISKCELYTPLVIPKIVSAISSRMVTTKPFSLAIRCSLAVCFCPLCHSPSLSAKKCPQGCGRFFEGTPEQMNKALNQTLGALPHDTKVYVRSQYVY